MKTIDQLNLADRRKLTGSALRALWNLARLWALTDTERLKLLGITSKSTLRRWRKGQVTALRRDTFERISLLFGIFRVLNELFGPSGVADEWIRRPNRATLFQGRSALEFMLSGRVEDIRAVRDYLEAVLHG
jgi:uncharacterized protein (DUF2384 family)